jgi:ComF family protein
MTYSSSGLGSARHLAAQAKRLLELGLDLVLPARCLGCGEIIDRQGSLCGGCWSRLRFITAPYCPACGHPVAHPELAAANCPACRRNPLAVDRARAALAYDDASRGLILGFKHGGRIETSGLLAGLMREAGRVLLDEADLVLPVPLHRWRLLRRGYNQSALLAQRIARGGTQGYFPDLIERSQATRSQQHLSKDARNRNITAAAFRVRKDRAAVVRDARILLIDDVLTTGATLGACARILRDAGAARVDALVLARVVHNEALPI